MLSSNSRQRNYGVRGLVHIFSHWHGSFVYQVPSSLSYQEHRASRTQSPVHLLRELPSTPLHRFIIFLPPCEWPGWGLRTSLLYCLGWGISSARPNDSFRTLHRSRLLSFSPSAYGFTTLDVTLATTSHNAPRNWTKNSTSREAVHRSRVLPSHTAMEWLPLTS